MYLKKDGQGFYRNYRIFYLFFIDF